MVRFKMRFRFAFFAFCCVVAVKCVLQEDEGFNRGRNRGTLSPVAGETDFESLGREDRANDGERSSSDSRRNSDHRDVRGPKINASEGFSFGPHAQNSKNTVNRPNQEEEFSSRRHAGHNDNRNGTLHGIEFSQNNRKQSPFGGHENRPTNFENQQSSERPKGHTDNRENSQHGPGFSQNNREQSPRPHGGYENRPSGHNHEGQPIYRPVGSLGHNQPSSNRSEGGSLHGQSNVYRPDTNGEQWSNRPPVGSSHITDHAKGGTGPSGHRPVGEQSFGRPTEGSSEGRPSEFRPSNEMGQFGRPTGEPVHGQETGSRPGEHGGHSGSLTPRPSEQNHGAEKDKDKDKEDDEDVCFPNLGCFKMGKPWKSILRPIGPPHAPEKIQTTVHFYSRESPEKQKNITVYPQINMGEVRFDPRKITAMIVHGFSNSGNATWMKDMKNVYLKKVDANVMIVDWGKGAQLLNYLQVAGNTRVVGKQLGLFVKHLKENYGADVGKFHLIGHSLGAQICSYLAKEVPGIARLTALDPAQPGFEGFDAELRLDKTDAEFVDVIHTDARPFIPTLGFGMITPHGHVDFYMNGGFDQPGCIPPPKKELPSIKNFLDFAKYPVEVIAKTVACPHGRAYEYLIEAFNETDKCIFWGHKADAKNVFKSVTNTVTQGLLKKFTALSTTCSKEDCIPVGFATKKSPLRGVFVVTTGSRSPYCISEPGIPPETPPQETKQESFMQKMGRRTGLVR